MTVKGKITIRRLKKPDNDNINESLQWFCKSLGLFGTRDKDKSRFRMFVILLRSIPRKNGLTSDEISDRVGLSRGTVVHHLNQLMDAGIVVYRERKYLIKVDNLSSLIEDIEYDMLKTMSKLKEVAEDIDKRLEL